MAFTGPQIFMRSRASKRVSAIASGTSPKTAQTNNQESAIQRRKAVQETLNELEVKQREQKKKLTLKRKIEQAGIEMTPESFHIASAVFGLVGGVFVALFSGQPIYVAALSAFVIGIGVPRWALTFLINKRQAKFTEEFANALDVIVRGIKSGLPVNECLQIIGNESADPVGPEFTEIVEGQKLGVPLEQGLQRMYERMPVAELNFFMIVLTIQQKTGGNLSEALGNLSHVIRARKLMRAKIQAMSSEAKASAMIIGSLPPGVMAMVYMTTPDYINLLFTEQLGNFMVIGGVLWMLTGVFIMRKMINFNF